MSEEFWHETNSSSVVNAYLVQRPLQDHHRHGEVNDQPSYIHMRNDDWSVIRGEFEATACNKK
jgi:hypothetical protein